MEQEFTIYLAGASAAVGALMPFVVSFFKRASWSGQTKGWMALLVSLIGAGVVHVSTVGVRFETETYLAQAGIVFAASQVFYNQWFKDHLDGEISELGPK